MASQTIYILISIIVLAIIAIAVVLVSRKKATKKLSPTAGLSFAFIVAGIIFGENHILGYILIGIGVLLAVVDIIVKMKR